MNSTIRRLAAAASLVAVALAVTATPALAATSWNADEAFGEVGRREVQVAFGWSDRDLQRNARLVEFRVSALVENLYRCAAPESDGSVETFRQVIMIGGRVRDEVRVRRNRVRTFAIVGYAEQPRTELVDGAQGPCPLGYELEGLTQTQLSFRYDVSIDGVTWVPVD